MRVKIFTLGCKVNQYETRLLEEKFINYGWQLTNQEAELYVVNTCSVTAKADQKSREIIYRLRRKYPQAKIVACGCSLELDPQWGKDLPINFSLGQKQKHLLPELLLGKKESENLHSITSWRKNQTRAFVKIQDGCDRFCSFCKVVLIRGKPSSRQPEKIKEEISRLTADYYEIVLCGINIGLYGKDRKDNYSLAKLLKEILALPKLGRLRLSSIEPDLVNNEIIDLLTHPKFCPHLHLPFQSGDDNILNKMNKRGSSAKYLNLVNKLRKLRDDIAISCDIMVGFPGEGEKEFKNTFAFLKEICPMRMHIFPFSPRKGTKAAEFTGQVKKKIVILRQKALKKLAEKCLFKYWRLMQGKRANLLIEKSLSGKAQGYTEHYLRLEVNCQNAVKGQIKPVVIGKKTKLIGLTNAR